MIIYVDTGVPVSKKNMLDPLSQSFRQFWATTRVLWIKVASSEAQPELWTTESSLQPFKLFSL